jgi:hypothetical protein
MQEKKKKISENSCNSWQRRKSVQFVAKDVGVIRGDENHPRRRRQPNFMKVAPT